ncbi:glycine-rich RNA-binding protein 2, mitochondrial isoform X2 [Elaeis guineensis]|uniref:Glycine-rich RNA-binding protein 2, mitochondrial isoform X2 n=1 Tax=Elaeis guineensis var. tenera TaxID=51953 RepID=A0A6J0PIS4_ELAGV|nr:glycine-rich RNA-binding protein 2, mitochondrial isoform X2 [Elaeis guineensis]XP_019706159.1 glycine-rich RNA-binding protein 2, mitochondrial isoform X2 [Elaeis guineensis]XP_019706160.1 glycine-rich RNA-binding protein 2, mitochondrial isoform X2 [Elaeis guineensis]XP_019706163.1 glycine-rich RNA-binding protein 2, mitochondrial isoform X2 [Elaeis guineensis]
MESMWCSRGQGFQRAVALPVRRFFARDASTKLFVGGLSYDTNEAALNDAFCQHGEIVEVKVICDRITGKSKGYGFVQFCMESEATNALQKMDGQLLDGRNIRVHYAKKG